MPNTVMDTINASYDRFFDSEKKIAKYIIEHYDEVVEMTVSELAKASSASEASVSCFCRRIGMKGFHQLKISLAKEMAESSRNPVRTTHEISEDTISQSLQNILANKMDELTRTVSMIDEKELHEVLERLKMPDRSFLRLLAIPFRLLWMGHSSLPSLEKERTPRQSGKCRSGRSERSVRDVMKTLTEIRRQWGMFYPFE